MSKLLLVILLLTLCSCSNSVLRHKHKGPHYTNEDIGIHVHFQNDIWELYTNEENAPPQFKENFRNGFNLTPVLFIGTRKDKMGYTLCRVEPLLRESMTVEDYCRALHKVNNRQSKYKVKELKLTLDKKNAYWHYTIRTMGINLTFKEFITFHDGVIFRVIFWNEKSIFTAYEDKYLNIVEDIAFKEGRKWNQKWKGILDKLDKNIPGIQYPNEKQPDTPEGQLQYSKTEKNLLWEISGINNKVYLFGSINFGHPNLYPLPTTVENAFNQSPNLVLEVDLFSEESRHNLKAISSRQINLQKSIQNTLPAQTYQQYLIEMKKLGIPASLFEKLPPWVIAKTLTYEKTRHLGYSPTLGTNYYFYTHAKRLHKKIHQLETITEQYTLFTREYDQTYLSFTLEKLPTLKEDTHTFLKAWKEADTTEIMETSLYPNNIKNPTSSLIYRRNSNMVNSIEHFLTRQDDYFIAVNTTHLIGKKSIPYKLMKRGYRVTKL